MHDRPNFTFCHALAAACCVLVCLISLATPSQAHWLTKLLREAGETGGSAARHATPLAREGAHLKRLPDRPDRLLLAATVSTEGHWTFLNRAGQHYTAANPTEMARVARNLAAIPNAAPKALDIIVTENVLFDARPQLAALPAGSRLRVVANDKAYTVRGAFRDPKARLAVDVKPNVQLQLTTSSALAEGLWQLARPMRSADVRVLALDAGGPAALKAVGRIDPKTRRFAADRINPRELARALPALRGQTVVLSARIEGAKLVFRGAGGGEQSVGLKGLIAAAERSDVNLIILNSRTPRQPGDRNWLWQRVSIDGLDKALERASRAEFLSALAGDGRLVVAVANRGRFRAAMLAQSVPGTGSAPSSGQLGMLIAEVVSEVAGTVLADGIRMELVGADRQEELDARIVPGIPSDLQFGYIGLLVLGLLGWPVASAWWAWLWPPEQRDEYGHAIGYQLAKAVRGALFVMAFLPIVAPFALVWRALSYLLGCLMLPVRWLRRRSQNAAATLE